jgi:acyl-CoA synthetase (AMP-forming)/AMP-acid ligase II
MTVHTAVSGHADTLPELMDLAADQIGDREAYVEVETGRRLTFREWIDAGDGVAAHLAALGVGHGDVVAISLPPSIDYAIACLAVARLGAVVTGINTRLGPREVAGILDRCEPRAVIVPDDAAAPLQVAVVVTRSEMVAAAASGPATLAAGRPRPDDPAVVIWTSGTTGLPKGAWFDHRNLAAAVRTAGVMTVPFDRRISGIPMAHAGFMAKLWEQLAMGVTMVLTPTPWTAESMLRVLVDERITVGAGVPTQWAKLLELPGIATADLRALRLCLAATAPAPPELVERMHDVLGCPVVVRYAMTESPSITGTAADDPPSVQYRTVGRPQDGIVVDIVADDGRCLPRGEVGRVRITGPCVMRGYWRDAAGTREVLDDEGRLLSGDLAWQDDAEHPGIQSAAVVGIPRPIIGEIGVAFVVPAATSAPDLAEVRAWVAARLADYKAPDELHVVDALPLTAMLKVDKDSLRAAAQT